MNAERHIQAAWGNVRDRFRTVHEEQVYIAKSGPRHQRAPEWWEAEASAKHSTGSPAVCGLRSGRRARARSAVLWGCRLRGTQAGLGTACGTLAVHCPAGPQHKGSPRARAAQIQIQAFGRALGAPTTRNPRQGHDMTRKRHMVFLAGPQYEGGLRARAAQIDFKYTVRQPTERSEPWPRQPTERSEPPRSQTAKNSDNLDLQGAPTPSEGKIRVLEDLWPRFSGCKGCKCTAVLPYCGFTVRPAKKKYTHTDWSPPDMNPASFQMYTASFQTEIAGGTQRPPFYQKATLVKEALL